MEHGRDHENRQLHVGNKRANNTPPTDPNTALEEQLRAGGSGVFAKEGQVGAQAFQGSHSGASGKEADPARRTGGGSDVAPTKQAEAREQQRHRLERQLGRTPAGEAGLHHDRRSADVTPADLEQAAREADRRVAGHEINRTRP